MRHTIAPILAAWLALGASAISITPAAAEEFAPVANVDVSSSSVFYDRRSRTFSIQAQVVNGNDDPLSGPIWVVVTSSKVPVLNWDGTTDGSANPYKVVNGPVGPGEASELVTFQFEPGRTRPQVSFEARGRSQPLQLLHNADMDGSGSTALESVETFSAILEGFRATDPVNTLTLSSGDNYIPGPRFFGCEDDSLEPIIGVAGVGRCDIAFMNAMEYQASAVGNHELDQGPGGFAGIIDMEVSEDADVEDWPGAQFPYLSTNLDFTTDEDTTGLVVADGQPADAIPNGLAGAATVRVGDQTVGLVGAVTPSLAGITSVGGITVSPEDSEDIDALAAVIQTAVDSLEAQGINKIILLAHMQQISVEKDLAERLSDVDIIIAGGSNTLLVDGDDYVRPEDLGRADIDTYPLEFFSPEGEPVLVVNTDADYKYLGRLVATFDALGKLDLASLDTAANGAWATDEQGLVNAEAVLGDLEPNAEVASIKAALDAVLEVKDGNILGNTAEFLEGRRTNVRTEETNLGNLTADANLWQAQQYDASVALALKNGGGIRAEIGQVLAPPGSTDPDEVQLLPPAANPAVGKEEGDASQLDIETSLRFNNGLTLLTVTAMELKDLLEHGVAATEPGATPGRFPQVGGLRFSFDPDAPARIPGNRDSQPDYSITSDPSVVPGERIRSLAIVNDAGNPVEVVVEEGLIVGDASRTFRLVILDFTAKCIPDPTEDCGDDYPLRGLTAPDPVNLEDVLSDPGIIDFAAPGSEQDAFAEYFGMFYPDASAAFNLPETGPELDTRIQNLSVRDDTVLQPNLTRIGAVTLTDAEIVAYDAGTQQAFVTAGTTIAVVDLSDPTAPTVPATIDVAVSLDAFAVGGVTSVDTDNGVLAAAVEAADQTDPGRVAFYDTTTLALLSSVEVGALPDMLTFTPDGMNVLVANEGEPDDGVDPEGSVSVIDVSGGVGAVDDTDVATADFGEFDAIRAELVSAGVRIFDTTPTVQQDLEPEYIAVAQDGTTAFVTLQENNAVAVVDIATATVSSIIALGVKDHDLAGNGIDASNEDASDFNNGINIRNWPVFGMFMPDAIASYAINGQTYYVTANEGDARDEDDLVKNLTLDTTAFPDAATLQLDENLGVLEVSTIDGDTNGDGYFDQLFAYGARSFTIWDSSGGLVFDSADDVGQITAALTPALFNADDGDPAEFDNRSVAKGAEPEAVTTGTIGGHTYAFVGLERSGGGVLVYDVTDPAAPVFVQYARDDADIAPEGLAFVPASDSPDGGDLLLISNEESKTLAVWGISVAPYSGEG
jgi:2',3'-cyclic-nucleotide 2'-phosphodiesterase (5'-nucleotidase family)